MRVREKKPNFLIVGAAKSGTTTLYHLLKQHSDIFMPEVKEPLYYISDTIKGISKNDVFFRNEGNEKYVHNKSDYANLFESVNEEKAIGESSATYLYYFDESIPKIKEELNDPKIIIILRNPVDKIFSQYKHLQRFSAEKVSFEEGLALEKKRISENYTAMYHYKAQGLYYEQVKAFLTNFSNVLILYTSDLEKKPISLAKDCFQFLNVDSQFTPILKNYNISSKRIKNWFIHKKLYNRQAYFAKMFIKNIIGDNMYQKLTDNYRNKNIVDLKVEMNDLTRNELRIFFLLDIEKLEKLINQDLNDWKQ